jgi:hypothetical protein
VKPWIGLALVHPAPPPRHHLEGRGVQGGQEQPSPIRGRRQRTVLIGGIPAGRARPPLEAPLGPMGLACGRKRREQVPKRIQGQTGQIQHLERAGLQVGESSMPHGSGLLSSEAQHIINRNELYYLSTQIHYEGGCHFVIRRDRDFHLPFVSEVSPFQWLGYQYSRLQALQDIQ